jgi:hypothetical protein
VTADAGRPNRRTWVFRRLFDALPTGVRQLAREKFALFVADPDHPSLRRHQLTDTDRGGLRPASVSVSVNRQYRAVYVATADCNLWYWVGTHADYNRLVGKGG